MVRGSTVPSPPHSGVDPVRPYGGLVPAPTQGTRAYRNAASYNQHLNQHQTSAQVQAAATAAASSGNGAPYRNPYLPNANQPQAAAQSVPPSTMQPVEGTLDGYQSSVPTTAPPTQGSYAPTAPPPVSHNATRLQHHHSQTGPHGHNTHYSSQSAAAPQSASYSYQQQQTVSQAQGQQHRGRAGTTNQMDIIPPAIARIANMGIDHSGIGRNALTPVLNRDDAIREWERRQTQPKGAAPNPYPQLEYLQQQAERMPNTWSSRTYHGGSNATGGKLSLNTSNQQSTHQLPSSQFQPPPTAIVVDSQERPVGLRDVMSSVRSAAAAGTGNQSLDTSSLGSQVPSSISTPPLAYSSSTNSASGHRYGSSTGYQPSSTSSLPYDSYDQRAGTAGSGGSGDLSQLYTPLQPHQYQYSGGSASNTARTTGAQQRQGTLGSMSAGAGASQNAAGSFYAPGVSPSLGGQAQSQYPPSQAPQSARSMYAPPITQPPLSANVLGADGRRQNNEMDVWSR